ncbi:MAG: hypothetical protein KGH61_02250 [Candidatus Micrarchaeota archaeon]|nr:hypothetical protein [Candidatus Micrarchaeota archaeon]MDE1847750.1 hypothetical protein [Candidatus Micrarchaeota archaeon]MDE1863893.1 hypothetical protein [Candidatus Micrarchaeota archaeon]
MRLDKPNLGVLLLGIGGVASLVLASIIIVLAAPQPPLFIFFIALLLVSGIISVTGVGIIRKKGKVLAIWIKASMVFGALAILVAVLGFVTSSIPQNFFAALLDLLLGLLILCSGSILIIIGGTIILGTDRVLKSKDLPLKNTKPEKPMDPGHGHIAFWFLAIGGAANIIVGFVIILAFLSNLFSTGIYSYQAYLPLIAGIIFLLAGAVPLVAVIKIKGRRASIYRWLKISVPFQFFAVAVLIYLSTQNINQYQYESYAAFSNSAFWVFGAVIASGAASTFIGWVWSALSLTGAILGLRSRYDTSGGNKGKKSHFRLAILGPVMLIALAVANAYLALYLVNATATSVLGVQSPGAFLLSKFSFPNFINLLILSTIAVAIIQVILIISLWFSKKQGKGSPWPFAPLPISLLAVFAAFLIPRILIENSTVPFSLTSISGFVSLPYSITLASSPGLLEMLLGYAFAILFIIAAALSISGALKYSKSGRKYLVSVMILAAAVICSASLISQVLVSNDNNIAVQSLNSYIGGWNHNVLYLLDNYSAFNSSLPNQPILYAELVKSASPNQTLPSVFSVPKQFQIQALPGSFNGILNSFDWNVKNPIVDITSKAALYSIGVLPQQGAALISPLEGVSILKPRSSLYNTYSLLQTGSYILLTALQLGRLFGCGIFKSSNGHVLSGGVGSTLSGYSPTFLQEMVVTTLEPYGTYSTLPSSSASAGWLILAFQTGGLESELSNGNHQCASTNALTNLTTYTGQSNASNLFYSLSLNQNLGASTDYSYYGINSTQVAYIKPQISYISYQDNYTVLDLQSLNLTDPGNITLYIDNKSVGFKRYYNFLVSRGQISLGRHRVAVNISGINIPQSIFSHFNYGVPIFNLSYVHSLSLNSTLYISPPMGAFPQIRGNELNLSIFSNSQASFTVSNLTLTFNPLPGALQFNQSIGSSAGPFIMHPLASNESVFQGSTTLGYILPYACNLGQAYGYNLTFDSSMGPGRYTFADRCV